MSVTILQGNCLDVLPTLDEGSVNCCVTSPPYWGLRDYGCDGQLGLEPTPEAYVANMVKVFREVRRVLRDDGTLWLNLGDSYVGGGRGAYCDDGSKQVTNKGSTADVSTSSCFQKVSGLKPKDLVGIPWRVAFALQADGWYLRQDIIWHKPNPMPESVTDRCTKAHEYVFLMSKSAKYYYDAAAIAEVAAYPGDDRGSRTDARRGTECNSMSGKTGDTRNRRSVWTVATKPYSGAHFATFPPALIQPCILAGCPEGGTVLDCFGGSGTTGEVASGCGRGAVLIELNEEYHGLIRDRIGLFATA